MTGEIAGKCLGSIDRRGARDKQNRIQGKEFICLVPKSTSLSTTLGETKSIMVYYQRAQDYSINITIFFLVLVI